jgi:hypothetical protein
MEWILGASAVETSEVLLKPQLNGGDGDNWREDGKNM